MKHDSSSTSVGSNIYRADNPEDIDLVCLQAVVFWYNEIEHYDFNNPHYSDKTGNDMFLSY